jgi:hypothetical protein
MLGRRLKFVIYVPAMAASKETARAEPAQGERGSETVGRAASRPSSPSRPSSLSAARVHLEMGVPLQ